MLKGSELNASAINSGATKETKVVSVRTRAYRAGIKLGKKDLSTSPNHLLERADGFMARSKLLWEKDLTRVSPDCTIGRRPQWAYDQ